MRAVNILGQKQCSVEQGPDKLPSEKIQQVKCGTPCRPVLQWVLAPLEPGITRNSESNRGETLTWFRVQGIARAATETASVLLFQVESQKCSPEAYRGFALWAPCEGGSGYQLWEASSQP